MPSGQTMMTNLFFACYMHYAVGCPYIDYYGGEAVNHIIQCSAQLYFVCLAYTLCVVVLSVQSRIGLSSLVPFLHSILHCTLNTTTQSVCARPHLCSVVYTV